MRLVTIKNVPYPDRILQSLKNNIKKSAFLTPAEWRENLIFF